MPNTNPPVPGNADRTLPPSAETEARHNGAATGERVLLVCGTPADGFTFVGPVEPGSTELREFTDGPLRSDYWWYAPLINLNEARSRRGGTSH